MFSKNLLCNYSIPVLHIALYSVHAIALRQVLEIIILIITITIQCVFKKDNSYQLIYKKPFLPHIDNYKYYVNNTCKINGYNKEVATLN